MRSVSKLFKCPQQKEGAGFIVQRPFPGSHISDEESDPFLLLDEFGPKVSEKGAPGAPWHPHRGFDTVTYLKEGEGKHQDSMGNSGILRDGEVQWMRAASGIIHDEGRDHPGGASHGFQLWVNLPKSIKMSEPSYQQLTHENFTWRSLKDHAGVKVKLIAGNLEGLESPSPLELAMPIIYADIVADYNPSAGRSPVNITIPALYDTCMVYCYSGCGIVFDGPSDNVGTKFGRMDHVLFKEPTSLLRKEGDEIVENVSSTVSFAAAPADKDSTVSSTLGLLLLCGRKICEPISRYGPFVMNTPEEIQQAIRDYQAGNLVKHKARMSEY